MAIGIKPQPNDALVNILKDTMVQGVSDALVQSITSRNTLHQNINEKENSELKRKYFASNEALLINDVKSTVYNTLSKTCPVTMRLLENAIVAGGCFASLFRVENPKDYDIFILANDPNRLELYKNIAERTGEEWSLVEDPGYLENNNINGVFTYKSVNVMFQFIFTKFKTREELINDFDFLHCCTSMTLNPQQPRLYITPSTYEAIKQKVLRENPNGDNPPRLWRITKFIREGWKDQTSLHKL